MGHPKTRTFKRLRKQITSNGRSAFFSERTSSVLIIIGIGIIVIGIVIFKWNESLNPKSTIASDKIGQLGDFIGGIVGSLWALAGVILFYVALSLQRKEFKLQRLELKATRSVFQQQSEQLKIQQRENTFFHL
jgi:drug/metabolite transporter (DMT)-like permease